MKRSKGRSFAYNLLVLLVFLAALEGISRLVIYLAYNRNFDSALLQPGKYGNTTGLKPAATGRVWGQNFNTDQFGCRKTGRPYNTSKKKWLFIGDSVTEGVGVGDTATFTSIAGGEGRFDSVNVLNLSLIGYAMADYYNVLRYWLQDSTVSRATIFLCLNDVYGEAKTKDLPVMGRQNWKGRLSGFLQQHYYTYKLGKLILFKNSNRYYQYDAQFYRQGDAYFAASMQWLAQCDSLCRSKGIAMNVVMLPYRSQLTAGAGAWAPQQLTAGFCRQQGISFTAIQSLGSLPANKYYLFADEIHFSEEGHRAAAGFLLSH